MLLFSTILPIKDTLTKDNFIKMVIDWNQGSPHKVNIIPDVEWHGERNIKFGNDKLWMQIEEYRNKNIIAVRYEKTEEDGVVWDTDYVMNFDEMKMSVRLDRSYLEEALVGDTTFSTPAFIQLLIRGGHIEDDGNLPIEYKPVFVEEDNIQMAADIINGEAKYRLPVVYISKTYAESDPVDIWSVAKRLKGVAHVLVQKNSWSGSALRRLTDSKNEYNGAVGIYFPNPALGHQRFLYHDYSGSDKKLAELVVQRVLQYNTSQRMDMLYTWPGVNNALLRDRYSSKRAELAESQNTIRLAQYATQIKVKAAEQELEKMRLQAEADRKLAQEYEALVDSVDEEMESMRQQIEFLTRQNEALSYEVQGLRERMASLSSKPILYLGGEDEFFNREITEWILIALNNELRNTKDNTRKADVLGDLIRSNGGIQNLAKTRAEKLKNILRGYRKLSTSQKSELEDLGFVITKYGGHYKLRYFDDGRYVATLASTASDHRDGENIALEIIRDMF